MHKSSKKFPQLPAISNVFIMLIFDGVLVRNYYFEDQKFKGHMKRCFRKMCLSIV